MKSTDEIFREKEAELNKLERYIAVIGILISALVLASIMTSFALAADLLIK